MNPDFAIILNFIIDDSSELDADKLIKRTRDVGVRAVSCADPDLLAAAGKKYTIKVLQGLAGQDISKDQLLDTIVTRRKDNKNTILNVRIQGKDFDSTAQEKLKLINDWMHMFGHALNEGQKSALSVSSSGFVLENRHANYQKYVFLKEPLPSEITVSGLKKEPNQVEWIQNRSKLAHTFANSQLKIKLEAPETSFPWCVLRLQAHRPEDDIKETKF